VKITNLISVVIMLCAAVCAQQTSQATAVNQIEELRAKAERSLGDYERVVASRDALTLQLQQAVGIDDKVLIQRAVSDIGDNRTSLTNVARLLETDRQKLMDKTSQELLAKHISETMYVYQLDFSRQIDHLLKESPTGLLLGLLIDAHKKAQTSFVYSDFIQEKPPVTEERASAKPVQ
jgi:hypothetical protein